MAKGTRITIDLGSEELVKAVKFGAVDQGRPLREIVIEALEQWLEGKKTSADRDFKARDFHGMMQAVSEYRRRGGIEALGEKAGEG